MDGNYFVCYLYNFYNQIQEMQKTKQITKESSYLKRRKEYTNSCGEFLFNFSPIVSNETIKMMMAYPQEQAQDDNSLTIFQFLQVIRSNQQYIYPLAKMENYSQQSLYKIGKIQKINSKYINIMQQMANSDYSYHKKIVFEQYLTVKHFQNDDSPQKINEANQYKCLCHQISKVQIFDQSTDQNSK